MNPGARVLSRRRDNRVSLSRAGLILYTSESIESGEDSKPCMQGLQGIAGFSFLGF